MHDRISPKRTCTPCGYKVKMSSMYHRLLTYDHVKRTPKIDGMGPFKEQIIRSNILIGLFYNLVSGHTVVLFQSLKHVKALFPFVCRKIITVAAKDTK